MVNSIIVTVEIPGTSITRDIELPCQIPVDELERLLLDGLKTEFSEFFSTVRAIQIWSGSKRINPSHSLAEMGIWDGSILTIKSEN